MVIEKLIKDGAYYFPEDIAYICKLYENLRIRILDFLTSPVEISGDRDARLREAINDYSVVVPKNVREKLTGMLFER